MAARIAIALAVFAALSFAGVQPVGASDPHAEPDPHAAAADPHAQPKPPEKPLPEPLPPRPTEYPIGHPKKGEKPAEKKPGEPGKSDPAHGAVQEMPPPVDPKGAAKDAKPGAQRPEAKPDDHPAEAKPDGAPKDGKPDEAKAPPEPALKWEPPKRYHFLMDTYTGLAIGGNDPVAYFTDGGPIEGSADYELDWGGTTWHFINEGNMAAFRQNPEVYAPKFGGRCAYAMSQGLSVEAQPRFFVIHRDRLYLFANAGNRAAFLTDPDTYALEATRQWPDVVRGEP